MKRLLMLVALCACVTSPAFARQKIDGYCERGGKTVTVSGITSTNKVQESYPSCTVNVYGVGTLNPLSIFSDNAGTVKANPFTADTNGYWFFYVDNGRVDVAMSGGGMSAPFTRSDMLADDNAESTFPLNAMSFSATPTFDASQYSIFTMTLTSNVTSSTVSNAKLGRVIELALCQDATGNRTFAWPASFANTPTIDPGVSKCSNSTWYYNGTNWRMFAGSGEGVILPANSRIMNGPAVLTLPTATDSLVGRVTTDTFANKSISAAGLAFLGSVSGSVTLVGPSTGSGTLTLPNATDQLVALNTFDTLANKTLTSPTITSPTINSGTIGSVTLNSPTLGSMGMVLIGTSTGQMTLVAPATASGTLTLPSGNDSVVARTSVDSMTNKTLVTPSITGGMSVVGDISMSGSISGASILHAPSSGGGTLSLPPGTDVLTGRNTTDLLANKIFTGASSGNNLTKICLLGISGNIIGTGTPQVIDSCTVPGNVVATGNGIRVTVGANQSAVATAWVLSINGQTIDNPSLSGVSDFWEFVVRAESTTTGAAYGHRCSAAACAAYGLGLGSLDWTHDQIVRVTASNPNPNVVTPVVFLVELVQ